MKKISILLPYKENFSPRYAGAASLLVNDTVVNSKYKKSTTVYGSTDFKEVTFPRHTSTYSRVVNRSIVPQHADPLRPHIHRPTPQEPLNGARLVR